MTCLLAILHRACHQQHCVPLMVDLALLDLLVIQVSIDLWVRKSCAKAVFLGIDNSLYRVSLT